MQASFGRLLVGDSEMAELVRTATWKTHELGAIEMWPVALRAALTTCFASRSPVQTFYNDACIPRRASTASCASLRPVQTFYNDACIPRVGDQHPTALGRHAPDIYSERWRTVRAEG